MIPSEMFFTSRDETPGKDGAKTPSLGEGEETTARCKNMTSYGLYTYNAILCV